MVLARLDDGLEGVGVVVEYRQALGGGATDRPEAARRIDHIGAAGDAHYPAAEPLQQLLGQRKMLDGLDGSRADDDVRLVRQYRRGQARNVVGVVLIVGVGVDDDVGTEPYAVLQAGDECLRQSLVARVTHHVIDMIVPCYPDGIVAAAIVDDKPLHLVESGNRSWQRRQRRRQRLCLVVAGDLDDQLHGSTLVPFSVSVCSRTSSRMSSTIRSSSSVLCCQLSSFMPADAG